MRGPIETRHRIGVALLGGLGCLAACNPAPVPCGAAEAEGWLNPVFDGSDAGRARIGVRLEPVASGCGDVAAMVFAPAQPEVMLLADRSGAVRWMDLATGEAGELLRVDAIVGGDRGLLGVALHPRYYANGRIFVRYTARSRGRVVARVEEYRAPPGGDLRRVTPERVHTVYEVALPFAGGEGGALAFGPDGMLYVGTGDGGRGDDPFGHGQNGGTALGSVLRLDVDGPAPFRAPHDNPRAPGWLPEVWAIGLRDPRHPTFDGSGRLVIADVGGDAWEEVGVVVAGGNHGWDVREGRRCHPVSAGCGGFGFVEPVHAYDAPASAVVGGHVAGPEEGRLAGLYVFADGGTGRLWAVELPDEVGEPARSVYALGRFPLRPGAFGRDAAGRLYLASAGGTVHRLVAERRAAPSDSRERQGEVGVAPAVELVGGEVVLDRAVQGERPAVVAAGQGGVSGRHAGDGRGLEHDAVVDHEPGAGLHVGLAVEHEHRLEPLP